MIVLFGRSQAASNRKIIARLNDDVVAAVRQPAFYEAGGVPDTFNGRFELLVLHLALVVRRMRKLPEPAPTAAQDLTDVVFRHLDPALRELGVGDMAVPKRMKKLVEAFLGRAVAYDEALAQPGEDRLATALSRNVYGSGRPAADLAQYVRGVEAMLGDLDKTDFFESPLVFPDPATFLVASPAQ